MSIDQGCPLVEIHSRSGEAPRTGHAARKSARDDAAYQRRSPSNQSMGAIMRDELSPREPFCDFRRLWYTSYYRFSVLQGLRHGVRSRSLGDIMSISREEPG
jgi:hypothetical protein